MDNPSRSQRTIFRTRRSLALAGANLVAYSTLTLVVACADGPTGVPAATAPRAAAVGPSRSTAASSDTLVASFVYDPSSAQSLGFGPLRVAFPAGAVCDPATSSYGADSWDQPCAAATSSVTFTARVWMDVDGHPRVRFSPDVRFVPGKVVTMTLLDRAGTLDSRIRWVWCPDGGACVDESRTDPSVATTRDPATSTLSGRVKHFSGYNVVVDFTGESTTTY